MPYDDGLNKLFETAREIFHERISDSEEKYGLVIGDEPWESAIDHVWALNVTAAADKFVAWHGQELVNNCYITNLTQLEVT